MQSRSSRKPSGVRFRRSVAVAAALAVCGWLLLPRRTESYVPAEMPPPGGRPVPPPGPDLEPPAHLDSFVNSIGMRMIRIPAGTFVRGSPRTEPGRDVDEEESRVTIGSPFWMSQTEVTQAQFRALIAYDRSRIRGELLPATNVNQNNCVTFCRLLGHVEGREYRLPTENEWEYACRAGTTTSFFGGDSLTATQARFAATVADTDEPAGPEAGPRAVGAFPPNAWGLHDMHGNVAEWTADAYHPANVPLDQLDAVDKRFFVGVLEAVHRGGGWSSPVRNCRSASRGSFFALVCDDWIGFRVVMDDPPASDTRP